MEQGKCVNCWCEGLFLEAGERAEFFDFVVDLDEFLWAVVCEFVRGVEQMAGVSNLEG
jgi:hypothetical protein